MASLKCPKCFRSRYRKHGKDRDDNQRFRCKDCGATFTGIWRPLGKMRLDIDKAELCLKLLLEGISVRSTERITGVHRDTICELVVTVGNLCDHFLRKTIRKVEVRDIQGSRVLERMPFRIKEGFPVLSKRVPHLASGEYPASVMSGKDLKEIHGFKLIVEAGDNP